MIISNPIEHNENNSEKLVSICIPVYNGDKYIKETINSVLKQSYTNYEIIITDNCSTDNTAEVVRTFSDNRIKYVLNEKNLGMAGNWNRAVQLATGTYIKLLCADDLLSENAIFYQVQAFEKYPEVSIVFSASAIIDENGNILLKRYLFRKDRLLDGIGFSKRSLLGRNIFGEPSNIMFRKTAYDKSGGYDTDFLYCTDWDFHLRLAYLGQAFYIAKILMLYRVSSSSETSQFYTDKRAVLIADTDRLIHKHKMINVIRIGKIRENIFKINTRIIMFLRMFFLKIR